MVDDFADSGAQVILFDDGVKRWSMFLDLDENSDLTVELQTSGGMPITLTSGSTGASAYHDLALVYQVFPFIDLFYCYADRLYGSSAFPVPAGSGDN